jgi:16S rRNA (guanine527-N7)-methyltransferase
VTSDPEPALLEDRPPAAETVFGDRLDLADRFVEHLATTAVEWGLIGPRELPRLWTRHVLNCAVVGELVDRDAHVVDVGSGAGLPGLALAVARPDLRLTLVEPLERRVTWLRQVADDLALEVDVRRARAEELAGELQAPVVTARAVAPLRRLASWGLPLAEPGGQLLAIKGQSAAVELDRSVGALRTLGAVAWDVVRCGEGLLEVPTTVVRVRVGAAPGRRPARTGPASGPAAPQPSRSRSARRRRG